LLNLKHNIIYQNFMTIHTVGRKQDENISSLHFA